MPLVYDELTRAARAAVSGERRSHTLDANALVHEAYLRLIDANVEWQSRAHFLALAARLMRRILIDHAKARGRDKRGGDSPHITVSAATVDAPSIDVLAVSAAVDRLGSQDRRKAQLVELHYFGGLTNEETAEALNVSISTIERELRLAKAWLRRELGATTS